MTSVPVETLQEKRAVYQRGVEQIDARLAQLEKEVERLGRDRLATLGAIQCIDILLTPPAAALAPADDAAAVAAS